LSPAMQHAIADLELDLHPGEFFEEKITLQFGHEVYEHIEHEFRGAHHPLVRVHPVTGRRALYMCGAYVRGLVDMHPHETEELLASIMDPARRGELYPLYHRLREVAPVHHSSNPALHGAWAITRFDHTEELFRGDVAVNDPAVTEGFNHGDGAFYETMRNMLVFVDSKAHARLRRLVVRAFTPRSIAKVQPITQSIAY